MNKQVKDSMQEVMGLGCKISQPGASGAGRGWGSGRAVTLLPQSGEHCCQCQAYEGPELQGSERGSPEGVRG